MLTAEMSMLEDHAELLGVSRQQLMENAGKAVFNFLQKTLKGKKVLVVCYHGNNGGDGFVLARYLSKIADVHVFFVGDKKRLKPEAREAYHKLPRHLLISKPMFNNYDVIVDALFGTGTKGELPLPLRKLIEAMNQSPAFKVSLDIPSGLNPDTGEGDLMVKADLTLTFHALKEGLKNVKNVEVLDIGIPPHAASCFTEKDLRLQLRRNPYSHKGDNGRVLIIGGSKSFVGAAALAGLAALRSGADLAVIACPEKVAFSINAYSPDLITYKLPGEHFMAAHFTKLKPLLEKADVLIIGNGLERDAAPLTRKLLALPMPKVVDAGALDFVNLRKIQHAILTPHTGELQRVLKNNKLSLSTIRQALGNNLLVWKHKVDKIVSHEGVFFNKTGSSGMTVGGTGDVLAGFIGGLVAQGACPLEAAKAATFALGRIGEKLEEEKGVGFLASELLERIPGALRPFRS